MRSIPSAHFLVLCGAAACSSSTSAPRGLTPGTATLDDTFTFMPAHSSAFAAASRTNPSHVTIVVTNVGGPDSCAPVQMSAGAGVNVASFFQVVVALDTTDLNQVVAPGTYSLGDGWQASYRLTDVTCATTSADSAIKGTLEIAGVDSSIHGIADMTFPGGRLIASFDAPMCDPPGATTPSGGGSACVHYPGCPVGHGADLNPAPTETCNEFP